MSKIVPLYGDGFYKNKSNHYFDKAMNAIAQEEYLEALNCFQQAYKFNPQNEEAYFYMGLVAYIQNEFEMAIEVFGRLFEKHPTNSEYAYRYARGLYEQERYGDSLEVFKKISEESEQYYYAQLYAAKSLHHEKRNGESVNLLISLLTSHPNDCEIRFELASIYTENKKYQAAIIELETCIRQDEKYVLAYYLLHDIYIELDEIEKAIDVLEKLKEKCPLEEEIVDNNLHRLRNGK